MARKNISLEIAVRRTAAILEQYFVTLSKAHEKKARRDLHLLAARIGRRARRSASGF